jgi:2-oxo-3-hexenedioate decarboxylase
MDERQLLDCIDAVGHGCEIVQSVFPGWRFKAADTVAAFALHGRYLHGPLVTIAPPDREQWLARLTRFEMVLFRDGQEIDRGSAENVLGGPLSALMHFVRGLSERPLPFGVRAGDLVTTGTVTRAFPVRPGERWTTQVVGLPLPGMDLLFT